MVTFVVIYYEFCSYLSTDYVMVVSDEKNIVHLSIDIFLNELDYASIIRITIRKDVDVLYLGNNCS